MDLVRKILLTMEADPHGFAPSPFIVEGYDEETTLHHAYLMAQGDLITADDLGCLTRRSTATCSACSRKEGTLIVRLSERERQAFIKKNKTPPVRLHGAVMAEYVEIPDRLLRRMENLKEVFDASYRYAVSLKPKAPTKKASAARKSTGQRTRTRPSRR
jgi:hypothetical protein